MHDHIKLYVKSLLLSTAKKKGPTLTSYPTLFSAGNVGVLHSLMFLLKYTLNKLMMTSLDVHCKQRCRFNMGIRWCYIWERRRDRGLIVSVFLCIWFLLALTNRGISAFDFFLTHAASEQGNGIGFGVSTCYIYLHAGASKHLARDLLFTSNSSNGLLLKINTCWQKLQ